MGQDNEKILITLSAAYLLAVDASATIGGNTASVTYAQCMDDVLGVLDLECAKTTDDNGYYNQYSSTAASMNHAVLTETIKKKFKSKFLK